MRANKSYFNRKLLAELASDFDDLKNGTLRGSDEYISLVQELWKNTNDLDVYVRLESANIFFTDLEVFTRIINSDPELGVLFFRYSMERRKLKLKKALKAATVNLSLFIIVLILLIIPAIQSAKQMARKNRFDRITMEDVRESIGLGDSAFKSKNYGRAKYFYERAISKIENIIVHQNRMPNSNQVYVNHLLNMKDVVIARTTITELGMNLQEINALYH